MQPSLPGATPCLGGSDAMERALAASQALEQQGLATRALAYAYWYMPVFFRLARGTAESYHPAVDLATRTCLDTLQIAIKARSPRARANIRDLHRQMAQRWPAIGESLRCTGRRLGLAPCAATRDRRLAPGLPAPIARPHRPVLPGPAEATRPDPSLQSTPIPC